MLKHNSRNVSFLGFFFFFPQIFEWGNTYENFDQKKSKHMIFAKKSLFGIFWHFLVKIF